jgi:cytoskeletal protein CcmA (bactofilin family)
VTESQPCVIGLGASFEGKISFSGVARIEGTARGEVRGDGTLIIAKTGSVEANVSVDRLIVEGALRGEVRAKSGVEIAAGAHVEGGLATPRLRVAEGAFLSGRIEMGEAAPAA